MLNWLSDPLRQRRMVTRRDALRAGFLGTGGLVLSDLFRMRAAAGLNTQPDTAVLLLFVHGGPSQFETYDCKPNAPSEIRGPFLPIPTNVPGIDVCEHLPLHAQTAHRFSLIRSCCHDQSNHFEGHARFLSGYGQMKTGTAESHYPMVGAVVNRTCKGRTPGLPAAVAVGGVVLNGPDYSPGIAQGYWSPIYRPAITNGGLRDASLTVSSRQLEDRMSLLSGFDKLRSDLDVAGTMDSLDAFNREAVEVLTTDRARKAFDLSLEDPKIRERYGDGYGQEVLMARRLVEAGVSFVTVRAPGSSPGSKAYDWDDHAVNWDLPSAMLGRLPKYDQIVTTLINDLYDRGLDKRVLLIVTGEFGRTPRLEYKDGRIGRDHWPNSMSILVSGGGIKTGQVIGATNSKGEHPIERPLDPQDILATIYQHLGINPYREFPDPQGRPIALTQGKPVNELW